MAIIRQILSQNKIRPSGPASRVHILMGQKPRKRGAQFSPSRNTTCLKSSSSPKFPLAKVATRNPNHPIPTRTRLPSEPDPFLLPFSIARRRRPRPPASPDPSIAMWVLLLRAFFSASSSLEQLFNLVARCFLPSV